MENQNNQSNSERIFNHYRSNIIGALQRQKELLENEGLFEKFAEEHELEEMGTNYPLFLDTLKMFFKNELWELEDASWDIAKEQVLDKM